MASKAQPLKIGPFTGGLNMYSDPSTIANEEVAYLNNLDIDLDGTLVSRPPITKTSIAAGLNDLRVLGVYISAAGVSYILTSATNTAGTSNYVLAYNITANTFAIIGSGLIAAFKVTSMTQYQAKCWFTLDPAVSGTGGYSWDGTTWTAVAAMAKGISSCVYKERIFVASGAGNAAHPSQVTFSNAANPTLWTGTDFFYVADGDGQGIVKIYVFSSSIVVFKSDSTFMFAYESSPTKGQVQVISATLGLDNSDCFAEAESVMYIMSDSRVYTITNWNWEQISVRIPFPYANAHTGFSPRTASISLIGNRLVCRYFDSVFVLGIKTHAWTKWTPNALLTPDFWIRSPIKDTATGIETYFGGNYLINDTTTNPNYLYKLKDTYTSGDTEAGMICEVRSKVYNMDVPFAFKRLMWWGVDLLANTAVLASIVPVTYGVPVKWSDITSRNLTWLQRANYTWGAPLDITLQVNDSANINNFNHVRMFVKYIKSVRYRQIQFILKTTIDGSTLTGPFQIFSVTAFVLAKEKVTKQVS